MRRILVAQADSSAITGGPAFPLTVGVTPWLGVEPLLAVVVKVTLGFAGSSERVRAEPLPDRPALCLDVPSALPGATDDELELPSDFVVRKPACDVLLVGHAHASSPTRRIEACLRVGAVERAFSVVADEPSSRIPLCRARLRSLDGVPMDSVGPVGVVGREQAGESIATGELGRFQSACPAQRLGVLAPDALVDLVGLAPSGPRRLVELPGLAPRVSVESLGVADRLVELACDTLIIDTDFERVALVWRGTIELATLDGRELQRLVVSLERAEAPRSARQVLRALGRGELGWAVEEEDVRLGRVAAPDETELQMARLALLEHGADPVLTLEQYARVSAELAEQDRARDRVLERHLLDEDEWTIEERAWLERMGESASSGDGRVAVEFGELFVAAQDALRGPDEPKPIGDYAEILVALEDAEDPTKLFESHGLRLAQWMRLDRHWQSRAKEDRATAAELDRWIQIHRARTAERAADAGAPPPPEAEP